jgi:orotate phosphoribosyltransferase
MLANLLPASGQRRRLVAAAAAELGAEPLPDMLVSAGTEALVLTSMLAGELGLPMAYLRPKPKTHGRQQRVEGKLRGSVALVAASSNAGAMRDFSELVVASGAHVARVLVADELPSVAAAEEGQGEGAQRNGNDRSPAGQDIARILLDIGAVIIRQEPFRYASGLLSPIYTDCRLLISHPNEWRIVLEALSAKLGAATFDAIDGVATSGIPHASVLAYRLDKPLAYVADGVVAGAPAKGHRLAIVEDLVTTGKSVLEAAGVLRAEGLQVDECFAIFTYDRSQPSLTAAGIAFEPLSDLATLLAVGIDAGYFGPAERDAVLDWRSDPQGWTARHE